jgi:hypothetical protein
MCNHDHLLNMIALHEGHEALIKYIAQEVASAKQYPKTPSGRIILALLTHLREEHPNDDSAIDTHYLDLLTQPDTKFLPRLETELQPNPIFS